jgi:hypothetical protein
VTICIVHGTPPSSFLGACGRNITSICSALTILAHDVRVHNQRKRQFALSESFLPNFQRHTQTIHARAVCVAPAVASCSDSFGCTLSAARPKQKFRQVLPKGESSLMAKLTTATRKKLPKSDFVEKSTRKYPIPDAAHARDALARSSGKPEHSSVVSAVKRKFPQIKIEKAKR